MYRVRLSTVGKASSADRCSNSLSFSMQSKSDQFGYRVKKSVIAIGTAIGCHHRTPEQYQHHEVEAATAAGTIQLNVNEEIVLAALRKRDVKHQHFESNSSQTGLKSSLRQPKGPQKSIITHAGLKPRHHKKRVSAKSCTSASSKNRRPRRGSSSSTLRWKPTRRLTRNNKREASMKAAAILVTDRNEEDDKAVNARASLTTINRNESIAGALGGVLTKSEEMETSFIIGDNEEENGQENQPLQDVGGVEASGFRRFIALCRRQPTWKKCAVIAGGIGAIGAIGGAIGYGIYCLASADGSLPQLVSNVSTHLTTTMGSGFGDASITEQTTTTHLTSTMGSGFGDTSTTDQTIRDILRFCCPDGKDIPTPDRASGWECCAANDNDLDCSPFYFTQTGANESPDCSGKGRHNHLRCCVWGPTIWPCKFC